MIGTGEKLMKTYDGYEGIPSLKALPYRNSSCQQQRIHKRFLSKKAMDHICILQKNSFDRSQKIDHLGWEIKAR